MKLYIILCDFSFSVCNSYYGMWLSVGGPLSGSGVCARCPSDFKYLLTVRYLNFK